MPLSIEPQITAKRRVVTTEFERYEIKFWVSEPEAERVIAAVQPWMDRDPWSRGKIAQNVSLYLDTRHLSFWESHVSAAPSREKLRIRGYGDPPTGEAFFEVKRKVKAVTLKTRARLPVERVHDALRGRPVRTYPEEQRHLDEFLWIARMRRAEPVVLVAGYREGFVARGSEDTRMTIDRDLRYQPMTRATLAFDPTRWRRIPGPHSERTAFGRPYCLIEMKFGNVVSRFLADIVSRFGLRREAYSKYVMAIAALTGKVP